MSFKRYRIIFILIFFISPGTYASDRETTIKQQQQQHVTNDMQENPAQSGELFTFYLLIIVPNSLPSLPSSPSSPWQNVNKRTLGMHVSYFQWKWEASAESHNVSPISDFCHDSNCHFTVLWHSIALLLLLLLTRE
jgi:hypothetical protein